MQLALGCYAKKNQIRDRREWQLGEEESDRGKRATMRPGPELIIPGRVLGKV